MYCLKTPGGKLLESTASKTKDGCWEESFLMLCYKIKGFQFGLNLWIYPPLAPPDCMTGLFWRAGG